MFNEAACAHLVGTHTQGETWEPEPRTKANEVGSHWSVVKREEPSPLRESNKNAHGECKRCTSMHARARYSQTARRCSSRT